MKTKTALLLLIMALACRPDRVEDVPPKNNEPPANVNYLEFKIPPGFADVKPPKDNPLTKEGVGLGRHLFYEKRLSGDHTMSCGSCHNQEFFFTDNRNRFSTGITGQKGEFTSMPLFNLAWHEFFFWDGRENSLEQQVLQPITNPIEMNNTWAKALEDISKDPLYDKLFTAAFGENSITKENAAKALAQFLRTMVSANSKFDRQFQDPDNSTFTPLELHGMAMFFDEAGDCHHCHSLQGHGGLMGAFGPPREVFKNNGLDSILTINSGRERVTGHPSDRGKFKVSSVRNVEFSGPYMHDGRFETLEEVIEFYNTGGHKTPTTDRNMKFADIGRNWSPYEKSALVAFLKTLTDDKFYEDTTFSDPFR